jgi:hypothetical protein
MDIYKYYHYIILRDALPVNIKFISEILNTKNKIIFTNIM